jgi:UDP-N-acetyl-D-mannosaminuronic acid transferase (WecB/TagA/CpsF family)
MLDRDPTEETPVTSEQDLKDLQIIAGFAEQGDYKTFGFLAAMNADNLEQSGLDARTHTLVRLAALVAIGGTPLAWALHTDATESEQLIGPDLIGTLIAIAPLVGTPKVTSAIADLARATQLGEGLEIFAS